MKVWYITVECFAARSDWPECGPVVMPTCGPVVLPTCKAGHSARDGARDKSRAQLAGRSGIADGRTEAPVNEGRHADRKIRKSRDDVAGGGGSISGEIAPPR